MGKSSYLLNKAHTRARGGGGRRRGRFQVLVLVRRAHVVVGYQQQTCGGSWEKSHRVIKRVSGALLFLWGDHHLAQDVTSHISDEEFFLIRSAEVFNRHLLR